MSKTKKVNKIQKKEIPSFYKEYNFHENFIDISNDNGKKLSKMYNKYMGGIQSKL